MREEILVDARELPSPEPLEKVLASLGEIDESHYMKMIHRMEPMLLFPILEQNGFGHRLQKKGDEVWIYIFRKDDRETAEYIKGL